MTLLGDMRQLICMTPRITPCLLSCGVTCPLELFADLPGTSASDSEPFKSAWRTLPPQLLGPPAASG